MATARVMIEDATTYSRGREDLTMRPPRFALGRRWQERSFLLPAVLVVFSFVIFPSVFGIYVSFTDWLLNDPGGRTFSGFKNFQTILTADPRFWHALQTNFVFVGIGVPLQYLVALGLALLLNRNIRGRKFYRVAFLVPFMMSPVAVGWMVGRSLFDARLGPVQKLIDAIGLQGFYFFDTGPHALLALLLIDAWTSIPFLLILLLAGLQALPTEVFEAARIDGANRWQSFRDMTFPLLLPVSLTAIILRVIFAFKIVDPILVVTGGGPGSYTETLTVYIYRRGIQGADVGYATAMSQLLLIAVIATVAVLLATIGRRIRDVT
jgi:multiple sugar transport system permease protein